MNAFFKTAIVDAVKKIIDIRAVGIDISDFSAKYLQFVSVDPPRIGSFGEISLPEGLIVGGEIKKEAELADILGTWVAKEKKYFGSSFVTVCLPEEKSFWRLIQLPKIKKEEIENAIRWEIEKNIPLSFDELLYGFEIIEQRENPDHLDVSINAFPKAIVESYTRVLKQAGLQPIAIEAESQSVLRSIMPLLQDGGARIIADIGRSRTSFIIFDQGAVIYTTTIEFGGKIMEQSITNALSVSVEKAIQLKKEVGLDHLDPKVSSALRSSLSIFSNELKRIIDYYQERTKHVHKAEEPIKEIILVGGDANLLGLTTYLASTIKIPVRIPDYRWANAPKMGVIPPMHKKDTVSYASAIGLALKSVY